MGAVHIGSIERNLMMVGGDESCFDFVSSTAVDLIGATSGTTLRPLTPISNTKCARQPSAFTPNTCFLSTRIHRSSGAKRRRVSVFCVMLTDNCPSQELRMSSPSAVLVYVLADSDTGFRSASCRQKADCLCYYSSTGLLPEIQPVKT